MGFLGDYGSLGGGGTVHRCTTLNINNHACVFILCFQCGSMILWTISKDEGFLAMRLFFFDLAR